MRLVEPTLRNWNGPRPTPLASVCAWLSDWRASVCISCVASSSAIRYFRSQLLNAVLPNSLFF